jgi:hypothetical protein
MLIGATVWLGGGAWYSASAAQDAATARGKPNIGARFASMLILAFTPREQRRTPSVY